MSQYLQRISNTTA